MEFKFTECEIDNVSYVIYKRITEISSYGGSSSHVTDRIPEDGFEEEFEALVKFWRYVIRLKDN